MAALANAWASASRPAWRLRAPQQPWPDGATTSQPSAARTRAVAALTSGKKTRWTQPVSIPTRRRRGPVAGVTSGTGSSRPSAGVSRSMAESRSGSRSSSPARLARAPTPERW